MSPLSLLKLGGSVAPLLLICAIGASIGVLLHDRGRLAALDKAHRACVASVKGEPGPSWAKACDPAIAEAAATAAQARACEQALVGSVSGVPIICPAEVQRVIAERDARAAEVRDRDRQLVQARRDQAAAVARAEERGRGAGALQVLADQAIATAPRTEAGLMRFDAAALCAFANCPPAPPAGDEGAQP